MDLRVGEQQKNRTLEGTEKNLRTNLSLPKFLLDISEITYIAKGVNLKEIFNNKKLNSLINFKNLYFYNKANLVNTKLIDNLKKSIKKETKNKPHD